MALRASFAREYFFTEAGEFVRLVGTGRRLQRDNVFRKSVKLLVAVAGERVVVVLLQTRWFHFDADNVGDLDRVGERRVDRCHHSGRATGEKFGCVVDVEVAIDMEEAPEEGFVSIAKRRDA